MNYSADDEISLMELWNVLAKRKGLILAILLASVIAAGLLIFFTPPVYESRAVVQIGQIGQIEPSATLVKRLLEQHGARDERVADGKATAYVQAASVEKDTNLISITAQGPTPNAVQGYLAQVLDRLVKEHRQLFDNTQKEQQQYLNLMQVRTHEMGQAIGALDKSIRTVAIKDEALMVILAPEKSKLLEQRMALDQKQMELRMAMSELQSKPTALIKAPSLPASPVKPRPPLYFALAAILGLMLGVFSAFIVEFISKARKSQD